MWTRLARRWAARGDVTLRLDLTGIGDAPPRAGEPENVVYGPRALEDVAAAVTFLRGQRGITDVRALGLCSGAYHAFKAAVAGQPLSGVVVINPLTFFWHEGESLDVPAFRVAGDVDRYQKNAFNADKWKKVLRGEVDVVAVAKKVGRHAATLAAARARDLSRKVGFAWREDLGAELEAIAKRKVDLRFVFASDDPGLPLLRTQAGSALPALLAQKKLRISMIDGPDHTFTPVWSHAALARALDKELAS
jgi:dienelactone hydrolase